MLSDPYLFLVLECDRPFAPSRRCSLIDLESVTLGRDAEPGARRTGLELDIQVPDPRMSIRHARLIRSQQRWILEDLGAKNGVFINGLRQERAVLSDGDLIELGRSFFLYRESFASSDEPVDIDLEPPESLPAAGGLATVSPELAGRFARFARAAQASLSIHLAGETGTGKEVLARVVHRLSGRPGRFVAVNCGALASSVLESELFGVRRGAYTGADRDRDGLIRAAEGGTLFLDEIGDLPLASQAAFLRILQEREVVPVGDSVPVPVDFRLVSATHADLKANVARGTFRADLLARINGFTLRVPALRERREDLGIILRTILHRMDLAEPERVQITPRAARALLSYHWPMNIRELETCLSAAVVFAVDGVIDLHHLSEALRAPAAPAESPLSSESPSPEVEEMPLRYPQDRARREAMIGLLRSHHGNISAVARSMGKARTQVRRWLLRYRLDPRSFQD